MGQPLPLTTKVSQQSDCTTTYKTISAKYGDGYSEDRPDGVNAKQNVIDILYVNLSPSDLATVYTFFDSVGGWDYVTWINVLIGDVSATKYKLDMTKGIKVSATAGNMYNVSFTMNQYFGF